MKKRIDGRIKITLYSDLCAGSGYSYAGIIDSDICHDDLGFPLIPAKRLKGCIRETLEGSLYTKYPDGAEALFGRPGDSAPSSFIIGNAYPQGYNVLRMGVENAKADASRSAFYDTQRILENYTHVVGQTRIEEGVAMTNTLRFTRAVNKTDPSTSDAMVFYADASCYEAQKEMLIDALRGTRHIGLKRTRGFGNVKCEWVERRQAEQAFNNLVKEDTRDGITTLSYRLRNVSPLMLSGPTEDVTRTYIPGANMIGLMASLFLEEEGADPDSNIFKDLFTNGKTIFTNAYPCDGNKVYYPAPEYINRLKKSKNYVYNVKMDPEEEKLRLMDNGNQPKKLRNKYVAWDEASISVLEVDRDIVYHHSHYKKNVDGEDGILYGMEVVRAGQFFAGKIITPSQNAEIVRKLLLRGDLYFGKSRSAQYGKCRLEETHEEAFVSQVFSSGSRIMVTFLSDAIFLNNNGAYTVIEKEVRERIADALGIKGIKDDHHLSFVQTNLATGYSTIWNLRKQTYPAIQAGSCFAFELTEDCEIKTSFVGERNLEGFGQVRCDLIDDTLFLLSEKAPEMHDNGRNVASPEQLKGLMRNVLLRSWVEKQRYRALAEKRIKVKNSSLGRITLMLRESLDEYPDDHVKALDEYIRRIDSIKTDSVKSEAKKLVDLIAKGMGDDRQWEFGENMEEEGDEFLRLGFPENEVRNMLHAMWGEYLMTVLVEMKYQEGDER